jgi:mRNA-degrading endonuclease toxin of MazEF toxin-antitoxin module
MKDFDNWNEVKKKVECKERMLVKSGTICICNFGLNIGYEIDGKNNGYIRPAFVLLGFGIGGGIVVPLTSTNKKSKFLIELNKESKLNLSQIRYLDSKRFYREVEIVDKKKRRKILNVLIKLFI